MANPAKLLHTQLLKWSNSGTTAKAKRGLDVDDPSSAWADHRVAVRLLLDTEQALDIADSQGIDTSIYRKFVPAWTQAIFSYPHGWDNLHQPSVLKVPTEQLQSLSILLDLVIPTFADNGKENFGDFLEVLAYKLDCLGDEHKFLREHAARVVRHLQGCLADIEILGEFQIYNALHDLHQILTTLKNEFGGDPFFEKAPDGFWSNFKKGSAAMAAIAITGGVSTGALNSAGNDLYQLVKKELPAISNQMKKPNDVSQNEEASGTSGSTETVQEP